MCEALKNSYELFEEIGRGKFGTVFRCYNSITNKSHAAKIIHKHLLTDSTDRMCLENESKSLTYLSPHPNILQISDVFEDSESLSIVTELCQPNFTLLDHITNHPLSDLQAASMMKNLLEAVSYCHKLGIAHRDIKPENILFDSWGNLKVCDFGSAEWFGDGRNMNGIVGTSCYVAPEVLLGREYNEKIDVWSSGVIMYIMLSGIPPFYGDSDTQIFEAVIRGNLRFPTKIFNNVSPSAKDLMKKMICRDPSRRISAEQALRHPWILSGGLASDLA